MIRITSDELIQLQIAGTKMKPRKRPRVVMGSGTIALLDMEENQWAIDVLKHMRIEATREH